MQRRMGDLPIETTLHKSPNNSSPHLIVQMHFSPLLLNVGSNLLAKGDPSLWSCTVALHRHCEILTQMTVQFV